MHNTFGLRHTIYLDMADGEMDSTENIGLRCFTHQHVKILKQYQLVAKGSI